MNNNNPTRRQNSITLRSLSRPRLKWSGACIALAGATVMIYTLATARLVTAEPGNWSESITIKGDLRLRMEGIEAEGKTDRLRQRVRARIGVEGQVHDDVKIVFQLASGSSDPRSTNQTFDEGFSSKSINLDIASFDWKPSSLSGAKLSGGKMKNPFLRPGGEGLLWDGDLRPEGLAASFRSKGKTVATTLIAAGFWVEESSSGVDAGLSAIQGQAKISSANGETHLAVGAGYFDYSNLKGQPTVYDPEISFGNSVTGSDVYMYDYNLLELFAEVGLMVGSTPLLAFTDYVTNSAPTADNTAWLVGVKVGKTRNTGSWQAKYNYRRVEKDAVLGAATDSDFNNGYTDAQGHLFAITFQVARKIKLAATGIVNHNGIVAKKDFKRLQLNAIFKL